MASQTLWKHQADGNAFKMFCDKNAIWAQSSEFVSSSIPSWQIPTVHAQPFRDATDLAFCLKVPLDSLLVWASSEGSGETVRMRRLAWTFAAGIGDKYQIRLTRSIYWLIHTNSKIQEIFPSRTATPINKLVQHTRLFTGLATLEGNISCTLKSMWINVYTITYGVISILLHTKTLSPEFSLFWGKSWLHLTPVFPDLAQADAHSTC